MVISPAAREVLFMEKLLQDITGRCGQVIIFEDNQACISMSKNPKNKAEELLFRRRTKHIDIRHHFVRDLVNRKTIELSYCSTEDMVADLLTKGLNKLKTDKFRKVLLGAKIN